jgi:hypothetical protein
MIGFSPGRNAPNGPEMPGLSTFSRLRPWCALALAAALAVGRLDALTLVDLLGDPKLTPRRFAAQFERFEYEFHPEVQPPDVFLSSERGDCDDYAILADYVLRKRNIGTRLVRVSLVGRIAHDVCYVIPSKAYLDYNNRKYSSTLEGSGRRLRQIANEVADSFEANWTSASEYSYDYNTEKKTIGLTVVKTDPPSRDPDA